MTEEEKKAIEVLEKYKFSEREEYLENNAKKIGKKYEDLYLERTWIPTTYERKQFTIVYNLIEKLQKENEDYEKDNNYLRKREEYLEKRREEICKIVSTQTTEFSVPKKKIREKIKVLEIQAEEFKNLFKSSYAMKDEYLYAKVKIQGYKKLLEEE